MFHMLSLFLSAAVPNTSCSSYLDGLWDGVVYWPSTPPNMTVIYTRWQSNMPFQGQQKWHIPIASHGEILSGRLNSYITRWRQEVSLVWRSRWWQDAVEKARTQQSGPLGLQLSSPGEQERHNADGHKSGGQYVAVLFGLQLLLTHKPFK